MLTTTISRQEFTAAGLGVLAVLLLHLTTTSMIRDNPELDRSAAELITAAVEGHEQLGAFARRPLTSWRIRVVEELGVSLYWAFVLVEFSLMFLSTILVGRAAAAFGLTPSERLWGIGAYLSSFTILFSFYSPNYSYDEPLQYCFIFLALSAWPSRKFTELFA